MQFRLVTTASLALLVCACASDTGNETNNVDTPESSEPAPAGTGTVPAQPPAGGAQAPEPSGDVTLSVAPAQTTEDATVTLTLRNGSDGQVGYNLCTSALETSAGRPVPTRRACTMELRTLEPGSTATYRYELPVNMLAGSYRLMTQVEQMGSGRRSTIRSNSFQVRSD